MNDKPKKVNEVTVTGTTDDGNVLVTRHTADGGEEHGVVIRNGANDTAHGPDMRRIVHDDDGTPLALTASERVQHAMKGPAMVNSNAYRTGWDAIFGGSKAAN